MRNIWPARFCPLRVPLHSTRPPLMSLSGHRFNQETKWGPSAGEIPAHLAKQRQHRRLHSRYLGDIDAEQLVRLGSQIKSSGGTPALVALLGRVSIPFPIRRQRLLRWIYTWCEGA